MCWDRPAVDRPLCVDTLIRIGGRRQGLVWRSPLEVLEAKSSQDAAPLHLSDTFSFARRALPTAQRATSMAPITACPGNICPLWVRS